MADIHFGTDGWRAIIGEDFTPDNLKPRRRGGGPASSRRRLWPQVATPMRPGTLIVGHDCRQDGHAYAELAAQVAAGEGFNVLLTEDYCPHPPRCAGRWPITTTRWAASCSRAPITPPSIWA